LTVFSNLREDEWPSELLISVPKETTALTLKKYRKQSKNLIDAVSVISPIIPDENMKEDIRTHLKSQKRKYYAAGAKWGDDDKLQTFLDNNNWEIGDDKLSHVVQKVKVNDFVVIKSTYPGKGTGILRVKAIGIVTNNYGDGRKLDVIWLYSNKITDISGRLSKLRHRIAEITLEDFLEIVDALDDYDYLIESGIFERPPENDITSEDNSSEADSIEDNSNDKIPFHLDVIEKVDRLNREPVAKSLARLINEDVFDKKQDYSFMVHLQGSWGSGKSTFLNLLQEHLSTEKRKWVVVKFNAWQNQHITPPWWTFINQIYHQANEKMTWGSRIRFKWSENKRRILKYTQWQKVIQFSVFILFVGILLFYGKSFIEAAENYPSHKSNVSEAKGLPLIVFAKLIVSIGAAFGGIYMLSKFVSTPFLMRNASEAESFVRKASDPMQSIKTHFEGLIDNINREQFEVAVFIDDLDRCNTEYTIKLLEGIQTLFKERRVLYLVAGDKDWIATCFETNYKDFTNVVSSNQKLGELFLEKAFQLSIRLPQISEASKQKYWKFILNSDGIQKETISPKIRAEIKARVKELNKTGELKNTSILTDFENEFDIAESELSDVVLEVLDENQNDVKHLLENHHSLIESNPRAIIRLANEYTMYRNILWSERIDFDSDILFRWIIIESKFPIIAAKIRNNIKIIDTENFTELIAKIENQEKFNKLFNDSSNEHGGQMTKNQLADILGIKLEEN
jgi:hypothetical protein